MTSPISPYEWQQQQAPIPGVLPEAAAAYMNTPIPYAPNFTGVAGFTPLQQEGWQQQLAAGHDAQIAARGIQTHVSDLWDQMRGTGGIMDAGNQGIDLDLARQLGGIGDPTNPVNGLNFFDNPYMDEAVRGATGAMNRNFQQNVLPSISGAYVGSSGGFGSSRQGIAEGIAASNLNQQVGDVASQMYGDMYGQGLQGYLTSRGQGLNAAAQAASQRGQDFATGLGAMPMMNNLYMQPYQLQQQYGQNMMNIGGQQQALNQARLTEARNDYNQNLQAPWQHLGNYANILNTMPIGQFGGTDGATVQDNPIFQSPGLYSPQVAGVLPPQPGALQTGLGLAATGLGIYGSGVNAGLWGAGSGIS